MDTGLEILTLGGLRILRGEQPVEKLTNQKAKALLIYLASTRRRQSREVLADLLWDERSQSQALANLRVVLVSLRKWFGDYLAIDRTSLALNPEADIRLDVVDFDCALQPWVAAKGAITPQIAVGVTKAVELYRGEFLDGFYLREASGFESWLVRERQRLHHKLLEALGGLVDYELEQGDYPLGAEHARRLLALDPLMESAQRQLMQLLAYGGQRAAALEAYENFRELLMGELAVEPEGETQALYAQIQAGELEMPHQLREPSAPHHNLPAQLTSFIGRTKEIADLQQLMTGNHGAETRPRRLVTLLGAGGSGKTRLSLEVARAVLDAYPQGAWLVELAPLSDPELVPQAALKALDLRHTGQRPPLDVLVDYLCEKQLLLVVDNCEHLVDACAEFIEGLLRACPRLSVLATSRERLNIPGETIYPVPTLTTPDSEHSTTVEEALQYESIRLFVERGANIDPGFIIKDDNNQAIVDVCRRLDGIPLAIELAAARLNVLAVGDIASRLDDCLRLLGGGSRTALPRHQTLKATIDWSYNLLSDKERILLKRLAVFAGSWTLEAAEEICTGEEIRAAEILEPISSLLNKSMVIADKVPGGEMRYRLLETIRQYGRARLREAGEEEWIVTQHMTYFLKLAERAESELHGPRSLEWTRRMEREYDNLRAALDWSLGACQAIEAGVRLANALHKFWNRLGYMFERRLWMEKALIHCQSLGRTAVRAKALHGHAWISFKSGDIAQARRLYEQSLEIWQELAPACSLDYASTLVHFGVWWGQQGEPDTGLEYITRGLEIFQKAGDRWGQAFALVCLTISRQMEDDDTAFNRSEEAAALFRETGDKWGLADPLTILGSISLKRGDIGAARRYYEAALEIFRDYNDISGAARLLNNLGELARCMNEYDQAQAYYLESLLMYKRSGIGPIYLSMVSENLAYVNLYLGDDFLAVSRIKQSMILGESVSSKTRSEQNIYRLAGFAAVMVYRGEAEAATCAYGTVVAQLERIQVELQINRPLFQRADQVEFDRYLALCRAQLDEATFSAAWERGRSMEPDQALELALQIVG